MEARCSSETSVDFQRTTRRHIADDGILHNHRCEYLKPYTVFLCGEATRLYVGPFQEPRAEVRLRGLQWLAFPCGQAIVRDFTLSLQESITLML
jgi:hypothetical protein